MYREKEKALVRLWGEVEGIALCVDPVPDAPEGVVKLFLSEPPKNVEILNACILFGWKMVERNFRASIRIQRKVHSCLFFFFLLLAVFFFPQELLSFQDCRHSFCNLNTCNYYKCVSIIKKNNNTETLTCLRIEYLPESIHNISSDNWISCNGNLYCVYQVRARQNPNSPC